MFTSCYPNKKAVDTPSTTISNLILFFSACIGLALLLIWNPQGIRYSELVPFPSIAIISIVIFGISTAIAFFVLSIAFDSIKDKYDFNLFRGILVGTLLYVSLGVAYSEIVDISTTNKVDQFITELGIDASNPLIKEAKLSALAGMRSPRFTEKVSISQAEAEAKFLKSLKAIYDRETQSKLPVDELTRFFRSGYPIPN
jgi:hypothetical protein